MLCSFLQYQPQAAAAQAAYRAARRKPLDHRLTCCAAVVTTTRQGRGTRYCMKNKTPADPARTAGANFSEALHHLRHTASQEERAA